jgi:hypothetical protein
LIDDPEHASDWSINDIIGMVGGLSEKSLGLRLVKAKLIDVWHLLCGKQWGSIDDLPPITHPSQLTVGLTCKLFFHIEDTRSENYYRYADFHDTVKVDKSGWLKREGEFHLDGLMPRKGPLEMKKDAAQQLSDRASRMFDMFIYLLNVRIRGKI